MSNTSVFRNIPVESKSMFGSPRINKWQQCTVHCAGLPAMGGAADSSGSPPCIPGCEPSGHAEDGGAHRHRGRHPEAA